MNNAMYCTFVRLLGWHVRECERKFEETESPLSQKSSCGGCCPPQEQADTIVERRAGHTNSQHNCASTELLHNTRTPVLRFVLFFCLQYSPRTQPATCPQSIGGRTLRSNYKKLNWIFYFLSREPDRRAWAMQAVQSISWSIVKTGAFLRGIHKHIFLNNAYIPNIQTELEPSFSSRGFSHQ